MSKSTTTKRKKTDMAKLSENSIVEFDVNEIAVMSKDSEIVKLYPALYDERSEQPVNLDLKKSIAKDGQTVPAEVTIYQDQKYLVYGHRRHAAIKALAAEGTVIAFRAQVIPFDVDKIIEHRIIENAKRKDLSVYEKVKMGVALARMTDSDGKPRFTQARVGELFGVDDSQVNRWLSASRLLDLNITGLSEAFYAERITLSVLYSFTSGQYLTVSGELDATKISEDFGKVLASVPAEKKITERELKNVLATETHHSDASKPSKSQVRKLIENPATPLMVVLALEYREGVKTKDEVISTASLNGIDIAWFVSALEDKPAQPKPEKAKRPRKKKTDEPLLEASEATA